MEFVSHIGVAGCRIEVRSPFPILNDRLDPAYAPFLDPRSDEAPDLSFHVRLETGLPPDLSGLPVVFDCSPAWTMLGEGDARWIVRRSLSHPLPFWVARLSPDYLEATVFCGDTFVLHSGSHVEVVNPVSYPFDQILLMCALARKEGVILHGAGLSVAGRGLLFLGRSGAGKTTLARILAEPVRGLLLSDDRLVVRKRPAGFQAYGTPWPGEGGFAENRSAALNALFFLVKAMESRIVPVAPAAVLQRLLPVSSVPWYDAGLVSAVMPTLERLASDVPAFELQFAPDGAVGELIARFAVDQRHATS
jgi:hypothetical protein